MTTQDLPDMRFERHVTNIASSDIDAIEGRLLVDTGRQRIRSDFFASTANLGAILLRRGELGRLYEAYGENDSTANLKDLSEYVGWHLPSSMTGSLALTPEPQSVFPNKENRFFGVLTIARSARLIEERNTLRQTAADYMRETYGEGIELPANVWVEHDTQAEVRLALAYKRTTAFMLTRLERLLKTDQSLLPPQIILSKVIPRGI